MKPTSFHHLREKKGRKRKEKKNGALIAHITHCDMIIVRLSSTHCICGNKNWYLNAFNCFHRKSVSIFLPWLFSVLMYTPFIQDLQEWKRSEKKKWEFQYKNTVFRSSFFQEFSLMWIILLLNPFALFLCHTHLPQKPQIFSSFFLSFASFFCLTKSTTLQIHSPTASNCFSV